MGLIHPSDLAAFQRDQAKRQSFSSLRRVRARLQPPTVPPVLSLRCGGADPDVLIAMDSRSASCRAAVLDPIAHLRSERVAVLAPFPLGDVDLEGPSLEVHDLPGLRRALPAVSTVLSAGDHVPAGALAHALAAEQGAAAVVVQHGMLLPLAAPLPREVHVATMVGGRWDLLVQRADRSAGPCPGKPTALPGCARRHRPGAGRRSTGLCGRAARLRAPQAGDRAGRTTVLPVHGCAVPSAPERDRHRFPDHPPHLEAARNRIRRRRPTTDRGRSARGGDVVDGHSRSGRRRVTCLGAPPGIRRPGSPRSGNVTAWPAGVDRRRPARTPDRWNRPVGLRELLMELSG